MRKYLLILLCLLAPFGVRAQDATLSLTVSVEDAEPNVGQIIISLFDSGNYLQTPTLQQTGPVDENGRCVFVFRGLATGEYAATAVYDEVWMESSTRDSFGYRQKKLATPTTPRAEWDRHPTKTRDFR